MVNVVRSKVVPPCLLKENPTKYRTSEILKAFDEDFFGKCYLTEYKAPANSSEFEVDHFETQKDALHLKFEWTNLFPIKESVNKIKPKNTPIGGYLNPCDEIDDVETEIVYHYSAIDAEIIFEVKDLNKLKALNTVGLLDIIHNGRKGIELSEMRVKNLQAFINEKAVIINNLIGDWVKNKSDYELKKIAFLLSRKSAFTMLLRSMSTVKKYVPIDFLD